MINEILDILEIRSRIQNNEFEISMHAFVKAIERDIALGKIILNINSFIIIEDYPNDKYSPSCLLLGFIENKRPIHIQVTRFKLMVLKIITFYEPNTNQWHSDFIRRKI